MITYAVKIYFKPFRIIFGSKCVSDINEILDSTLKYKKSEHPMPGRNTTRLI